MYFPQLLVGVVFLDPDIWICLQDEFGKTIETLLKFIICFTIFCKQQYSCFFVFLTPAHIKQKQYGDGQKDPDIHDFHVNQRAPGAGVLIYSRTINKMVNHSLGHRICVYQFRIQKPPKTNIIWKANQQNWNPNFRSQTTAMQVSIFTYLHQCSELEVPSGSQTWLENPPASSRTAQLAMCDDTGWQNWFCYVSGTDGAWEIKIQKHDPFDLTNAFLSNCQLQALPAALGIPGYRSSRHSQGKVNIPD